MVTHLEYDVSGGEKGREGGREKEKKGRTEREALLGVLD